MPENKDLWNHLHNLHTVGQHITCHSPNQDNILKSSNGLEQTLSIWLNSSMKLTWRVKWGPLLNKARVKKGTLNALTGLLFKLSLTPSGLIQNNTSLGAGLESSASQLSDFFLPQRVALTMDSNVYHIYFLSYFSPAPGNGDLLNREVLKHITDKNTWWKSMKPITRAPTLLNSYSQQGTQRPFPGLFFPKPNPTRNFSSNFMTVGNMVFHHHQKFTIIKNSVPNSNSWLVILQLKSYLPIFLTPENKIPQNTNRN